MQALADIMTVAPRSMRRRVGSTVPSVVTLAIGVGATMAVFGLANWILVRPVPGVTDPDGLFVVTMSGFDAPGIRPFSSP